MFKSRNGLHVYLAQIIQKSMSPRTTCSFGVRGGGYTRPGAFLLLQPFLLLRCLEYSLQSSQASACNDNRLVSAASKAVAIVSHAVSDRQTAYHVFPSRLITEKWRCPFMGKSSLQLPPFVLDSTCSRTAHSASRDPADLATNGLH